MKKKLLTSAAIASFLTAAGIVIPQADIFAADTPSTPHPSTVPNEHPSTQPSEADLTKVYEGGTGYRDINKKKVDSFADYTLKDISLDNNKNLNIQTSSDNLSVYSVEYTNEADGSRHKLNVKKGTVKNSYLADTSKLTGGNYLLSYIQLDNSLKTKDFYVDLVLRNEKNQLVGIFPDTIIRLDRGDLYKYDNKTKIKNLSEAKLPELGDKDYLVYSDKSQVGGNDVLKVTVKYKKGVERPGDKGSERYYSSTASVKNYLVYHGYLYSKRLPEKIIFSQKKDGELSGENGSFDVTYSRDSEGNDVRYFKNFRGMNPGHYYLRQFYDLDLTKGDLSNVEFDLNPSGKSVYRTDKVEEQPKAEKPRPVEPTTPEVVPTPVEPTTSEVVPTPVEPTNQGVQPTPVEPTNPEVQPKPEAPKNKILEQKVGDRRITVHFDGSKIPATNFYAEEVKDKDELAELTSELKAINPKYKLVNVYDLKLTDSLGNTVDSVGTKRTVTLTNAKGKSVVYYVYRDQNNKLQLEKLPTYDSGNGNIVTFEAEHFSKYALIEEQTDGNQPEAPRAPQPSKPEGDKNTDSNWNPFAQGQKAKEGSTEVKSEGGESAVKSVSNRKEGKALPNTGLQTTSYGFLAAIVGLFGAVALRRKNK